MLTDGTGLAFIDDKAVVAFIFERVGDTRVLTVGGPIVVRGDPTDLHTEWQKRSQVSGAAAVTSTYTMRR